MGGWKICGILDDNPVTETFFGYPVFAGRDHLLSLDPVKDSIAVAIGVNSVRRAVGAAVACRGFKLPALIHPSAIIGRDVSIGAGTVIMAGAIINPATTIGSLCILNTGCTIDHDNKLGQAVHVSPGAHLAGGVTVGDETWVGIGASVIQQRSIGSRCMVGAGAVVVDDVDDDDTVVGIPARPFGLRMPALSPGMPLT
jgi:sugar O-acyltransferase (sialic acid O-acetyltransferase NeuD family)